MLQCIKDAEYPHTVYPGAAAAAAGAAARS